MEEISNTIEKQRHMLCDLERMLIDFESKPRSEKTRGLVQSFLEEIESNFLQFKDNHAQLYDIVRNKSISSDDVPYLKEEVYNSFRDKYLVFKGTLLDLLTEFNTPSSPAFLSSTVGVQQSSRNDSVSAFVRLPKIDIPTFFGDYLAWIPYRDMFTSLVHNNHDLSKIQKYYYLKGSCKDTPLDIVNEYPASDSSYDLAWNALNLRYHDKRKIVDTVLNKLFSIKSSNGSAVSIQQLLDTTRNSLALLRSLGINPDSWDAILIYITVNKLDPQSRKEWEQSLKATTEIPNIKDLFLFLETTFRTLETVYDQNYLLPIAANLKPTHASRNPPGASRNPFRRSVHFTTASSADSNCPCCDRRHLLFKCFKFASMSSAAKREFIKTKNICHNCLNSGHFANNCHSSSRCQLCQQLHHTVIHNEFTNAFAHLKESTSPTDKTTAVVSRTVSTPAAESSPTNLTCNFSTSSMPQVLLATIRVIVKTFHGNFFLRALLDQGAQASLITEDAVQMLRLQKLNTLAIVNGVGGKTPCTTRKYVNLSLGSVTDQSFKLQCSALVLPMLTSYQPTPVSKSGMPSLEHYALADPRFNESGKIDLLLGGDVYGDIVLPQHKKFAKGLFLQLTHFGWVVSGPTSEISYGVDINVNLYSIDDQLRAFWEQEEMKETRHLTKEELACEEYFQSTCSRDSTGRYTVALPFISRLNNLPMPQFSHTDYSALRRLKYIESKFKSKPALQEAYRKFMSEYEELGHMQRIGTYPKDLKPNCYFLPHHGVLRESSSTTKLRVVFDGSSKRPPQASLNETLSAGPALQNELPTIITRWRRFEIGFRADLEKMFRQIRVFDHDQHYQHILWRGEMEKEIYIYKLCTVTYGTTSAPFLSIRVLQQLSKDERSNYPEACKVLQSDTYVDDVISGADTHAEALSLHQDLCKLLQAGCFNLRKWTTNSLELLNFIPEEYREMSNKFQLSDENVVQALGLEWDTVSDQFSFKTNFDNKQAVTKSSLLSDAGKLYDPLGWLAPKTVQAKIMFQKLWLLGLDWQDALPENLSHEWTTYRNNLKGLEAIKIPCWIGCNKFSSIEIHGFCDASQSAFAAVAMLR